MPAEQPFTLVFNETRKSGHHLRQAPWTMTKNQRIKLLSDIALFLFSAITLAWGKEFIPPAAGLDPGWREALVQATDQGLRFGKDIIFTFGPYHQLYTNSIGEQLSPLFIARLIYGAAWGAATISIANMSFIAYGWVFAIFMASVGSLMIDVPAYALQLALLLIIARGSKQQNWLLLALIYCGIIVCIFCKLSFAVSAGPILLVSACLLAHQSVATPKMWTGAILMTILLPLILWSASGQSALDVFGYLLGPNLSIVLGYSSAMATDGPSWQITTYWAGSSLLICLVGKTSYINLHDRLRPSLITASTLILFWTVFKAGMVRHDGQHASISGLALSSLALIVFAYASQDMSRRLILFPSIGALALGLGITSQYFFPFRTRLDLWAREALANTYLFVKIPISSKAQQKLQMLRKKGLENIKFGVEDLSLIPKGSSADAIPWDITDLVANGLAYRPRPIIQSYSVYSASLQEINKSHFEGSNAPSYLILSSQSIDGRNPPDLDYPSLAAIAQNYSFWGYGSKGSLILKHARKIRSSKILGWNTKILGSIIPENNHGYGGGRWIQLPANLVPGSRFSVAASPTIWRRLLGIAFKPSPLTIEVSFEDGHKETYRAFEASSRFIPLYPFVKGNPSLLATFFALKGDTQSRKAIGLRPTAIRFVGEPSNQGLGSFKIIVEQPIFKQW